MLQSADGQAQDVERKARKVLRCSTQMATDTSSPQPIW